MNKYGIYGFRGQYRFLSNFYPCTIKYENMFYPSVEHAYQAAKTLDLEVPYYKYVWELIVYME